MRTRIKICGITRECDALACAESGADAVGLVFYDKSSRYVSAAQAVAIDRVLPPFLARVGLFVNPTPQDVATVLAAVPLDLLQFHGDEDPQFCASFARPYIKAARVRPGLNLLECAARFAASADRAGARALLCDAFVEGYGGSGQTFDWRLIPPSLPLPLVLSGGLTPENVAAAIRAVRPQAVDVSSGVELGKGIKDARKIAAFIAEVNAVDEALQLS